MSERNKNIDDLFRQALADRQEAPPPHVWDAIEQQLDKPTPKGPIRIWWFWAVVGILLISTTAIVASYNAGKNEVVVAGNVEKATLNDKDVHELEAANPTKQVAKVNVVSANKALVENVQKEIKTSKTEQNRTNNTQPAQAIKQSIVNKRKTTTFNKINNTSAQQITHNTTTRVIDKQLANTALPRYKEEPAYMNTKSVTTNKVVPSLYSKELVRMPELVADQTKLATGKYQPVNTEIETSMPIAVATGLTASSENTLAESFNAAPVDVNTTQLAKNEEEPVLQAPAVDFHDTTKKKRSKKKTNKLADEDMLLDSEEATVDKSRKPLPIEFGIKAGFSKGTNSGWSADKIAFAPYAEYRFSDKVSLVFQPAYLTGTANTKELNDANTSYYEVTGNTFDSSTRLVRGAIDSSILTPNPPDTVYRSYTYTQQYDSVHVYYGVTNKQLWEIELPLLARYKVHKNISILAGVSATYSSVLQTKEEVTRYNMIETHTDEHDPQTFFVTAPNQPLPPAPARSAYEDVFTRTGNSLSSFQPRTITNAKNFFRYGYMIGVSANYKDRWMLDLLWHQSGVYKNQVADKNLQKVYTQPYIRVTLGYKLFKN